MAITFDPSSVSFGDKYVGDSETRDVTITNSDTQNATLAISGTGFSLVGSNTTIPKKENNINGTLSTKVKFQPTSTGGFTGSLKAQRSGSDVATAALSGTGVAAAIDATISEESTTSGTPTRFALSVPSPLTTLSMGRGIVGTTYNGFGVDATDNVFFNAGGMFWTQSEGDAVMQSLSNNIFSIAKGNNIVVGNSATSLIGKTGVFISSGLAEDPDKADANNPPTTSGFDTLSQSSLVASLVFTGFDALLAAAVVARGIYLAFDSTWKNQPANKIANNILSLFGVISAAGAATLGACSIAASAGKLDVTLPGVTVFGEAGILMGTPAFCSIYGAAGLVLASLYPFICGIDAEIYGVKSVSMTALRDATMQAWKKATLKSPNKVDIAAGAGVKIGVGPQLLDNPPYFIEMTPLEGVEVADSFGQKIALSSYYGVTLAAGLTQVNLKGGLNGFLLQGWDVATGAAHPEWFKLKIDMNTIQMQHATAVQITSLGRVTIQGQAGVAAVNLNAAGAVIQGNRIQLG